MTEFEIMLSDCKNAVECFVRFKLSSKADADDILQESFLTAFQKFDILSDKSHFKAWIISIAIHSLTVMSLFRTGALVKKTAEMKLICL